MTITTIWLIANIIGFLFSLPNFINSISTAFYFHNRKENTGQERMSLFVRGGYIRSALVLLIFLLFVFVGGYVLFAPPPHQILFFVPMILADVLLIIGQAYAFWERRAIERTPSGSPS